MNAEFIRNLIGVTDEQMEQLRSFLTAENLQYIKGMLTDADARSKVILTRTTMAVTAANEAKQETAALNAQVQALSAQVQALSDLLRDQNREVAKLLFDSTPDASGGAMGDAGA